MDLPEIDLSKVHSSEEKQKLCHTLGEAASKYGFLTLIHHGIEEDQVRKSFELARNFFSMELDYKMRFAKSRFRPRNSNSYRGYFPVLEEDPSKKEGFEFGTCSKPHPEFPETLTWPDVPGMQEHLMAMHFSLSMLGQRILSLLSLYLGWPEDAFRSDFQDGMSTFRIIHYPSTATGASEGMTGSSADSPIRPATSHSSDTEHPSEDPGAEQRFSTPDHTDSGFLTLLFQDDCGGLEALSPAGTWVEVPPRPGAIVMNLGDILSFMSDGKLKATRHRVRAPQRSRLSMPFFYEPKPLTKIPDVRQPDSRATITYAEFLREKILSFGEYAKTR
ncbi:MAG: isopenicillin N synthase family oxygenase [Leptospiraceae bacterium]|nr:isopenicillin N synthase family oxygenase [Leptospiraceae bacterium]